MDINHQSPGTGYPAIHLLFAQCRSLASERGCMTPTHNNITPLAREVINEERCIGVSTKDEHIEISLTAPLSSATAEYLKGIIWFLDKYIDTR